MKLVQMRCPSCGSNLSVDSSKTKCFCMFCGAQVLIDDEKHHVVYDNAHQSGYEFEMGRIRAQEDARQAKIKAQQEAQRRAYQEQIDARLYEEAKRNHAICPRCNNFKTQRTVHTAPVVGKYSTDFFCPACGYQWKRSYLDDVLGIK